METDAVRRPLALGSNTIVNVVDPDGAIGLEGCMVIEKSPACAPLSAIADENFGEVV